jgi:multidrug efflux pump
VSVALKPLSQRDVTADQVITRLRPQLAEIPGASLYLQANQDIRTGGRSANAQYQFTLQADTVEELYSWTPRILAELQRSPRLADVNSDQQDKGLETQVTIDRDTVARLGINVAQIDNTLYDAYGQRQVSTIYKTRQQYHVIMEWRRDTGRTRRPSGIFLSARRAATPLVHRPPMPLLAPSADHRRYPRHQLQRRRLQ